FRYNVFVIASGLGLTLMVVKPGLLGTLRALLFADSANDPSIAGRTQDYEVVGHFFARHPWLGRGPGRLIPVVYNCLVLGHTWLYQLVTWGLVGVVALATLHITAITLAVLGFRRSPNEEEKHLCVALIAVQVLAIVVGGTFDSLGFSTFAITLALLMGCCG